MLMNDFLVCASGATLLLLILDWW